MEFRTATIDDCGLINRLAERVWAPTYSHLMSSEQLAYMFEMMYGPENLRRAMEGDGPVQTFLIFSEGGSEGISALGGGDLEVASAGVDIGYIAYETRGGGCYYLQKIYLLPEAQGCGRGRRMLEMFVEHLREKDPAARLLGLNVNRENRRAIDFYLRNGFEITSQRDHPIGRGYFMNDYVMEREL